jgi:hypothetical protein
MKLDSCVEHHARKERERETQYHALNASLPASTPTYTDFVKEFAVTQLINIFLAFMELTGSHSTYT